MCDVSSLRERKATHESDAKESTPRRRTPDQPRREGGREGRGGLGAMPPQHIERTVATLVPVSVGSAPVETRIE